MKNVLFVALAAIIFALAGCKSSSPGPVLNPVTAAVCDVESTITSATGALIVSQCSGTDAVACGAAIQSALGNANLCAAPGVSGISSAQIAQFQADKAAGKSPVKGVVGNLACPLAESAVMGFLTAAIPSACGCTKSIDAGSIGGLLVSACEAAIPL